MNTYRPRELICNRTASYLVVYPPPTESGSSLSHANRYNIARLHCDNTALHHLPVECDTHIHLVCDIFTKHTSLLCASYVCHDHTNYKPSTICCTSEEWKRNNRFDVDCILTAVWFTMENKSSGHHGKKKKINTLLYICSVTQTQVWLIWVSNIRHSIIMCIFQQNACRLAPRPTRLINPLIDNWHMPHRRQSSSTSSCTYANSSLKSRAGSPSIRCAA